MKFELPKLDYEYGDLESVIDAKTMEIHHSKHHAGYVKNLNTALESYKGKVETIEDLLENIGSLPSSIKTAVKNNGGGHYNHSLYWQVMTPGGADKPEGKLGEMIEKRFGGHEGFVEKFSMAAMTQFGSGWAWLTADDEGKLYIFQTANQDNPLMKDAVGCECVGCEGECECRCGSVPILGIDVWEHAYYLKYQNLRADYVKNWLGLVNWDVVGEKYEQVVK